MNPIPCIGLVDDDEVVRRALRRLLMAEGYRVRTWDSADGLIPALQESAPDCLVLDVQMPGINGLDLQQQLLAQGIHIPIIFLTGQGSIPMTVRAMQGGAVNFLTKPVNDEDLFTAVNAALEVAARRRDAAVRVEQMRRLHDTLTPREQEVLTHLITGRLNKQVAADLGTSEQTIKVHRMRIMDKMQVSSVAELVRIADLLGLRPADRH